MKKTMALILSLCMMMALLTACGGSSGGQLVEDTGTAGEVAAAQPVTETSADDAAEGPILVEHAAGMTEITSRPERIFVLDLIGLDVVNALGLGDHVVGVMDSSGKNSTGAPDYLSEYYSNENIIVLDQSDMIDKMKMRNNSDTSSEQDTSDPYEVYYTIDADLIIGGSRQTDAYDILSAIAPTIILYEVSTRGDEAYESVWSVVQKNAEIIGQVYGLKNEVAEMLSGYEARMNALAGRIAGTSGILTEIFTKTSALQLTTSAAPLLTELGFENLAVNAPEDFIQTIKGKGEVSQQNTASDEAEMASGEAEASGAGIGDASGEISNAKGSGIMNMTPVTDITDWIESQNPSYVFIVGSDFTSIEEAIEAGSDLGGAANLTAYKTGHLYFLSSGWSTAVGGMTSFENMLAELEAIFG